MTTKVQKSKRPVFTEPNLLLLQVRRNGNWADYCSIKDAFDLSHACGLCERQQDDWRIVRCEMGMQKIYPLQVAYSGYMP